LNHPLIAQIKFLKVFHLWALKGCCKKWPAGTFQ